MKPEEILELVSMMEEYKPVVKEVLKSLNDLGPDVVEFIEPIRNYMVKSQIKSFYQFCNDGGMTRNEALILTLGNKVALQEALNRAGKK